MFCQSKLIIHPFESVHNLNLDTLAKINIILKKIEKLRVLDIGLTEKRHSDFLKLKDKLFHVTDENQLLTLTNHKSANVKATSFFMFIKYKIE